MARILIVDDDEDILRLIQFTLKSAGHSVNVASSGPDALRMLPEARPELIIADIMMPQMTGYQFTQQVRGMPGMRNLPILIYSARFQPIDKQTALEAGATAYIPKTIAPDDILHHVETLLQQKLALDQATLGATLAFFSLRGGVGVTSLAVNIATALALSHKSPANLIDLNPLAGHTGLMLGIRPQTYLAQILHSKESLSTDLIKRHLTIHSSGIHLLASPLVADSTPQQHSLQAVVNHVQKNYKYVLLDLPHTPDAALPELLPTVTKLVLVLSPDMPSLQSAVVALQMLSKLGLPLKNVVPVLNHISTVGGLTLKSIEKTLHRPLGAEIPFDSKMTGAINTGKPLVLYSPESPTTTAIARLAAKLIK